MKKWFWLLCLGSLFLLGCDDEPQQVVYQDQPTQEKIYVQDDSGKWMEYAMFMALMQSQHRTVDVHHYHYGTSNGHGGYSNYSPRPNEYSQMSNRSYKGTTIINKKVVVNNNYGSKNKSYSKSKSKSYSSSKNSSTFKRNYGGSGFKKSSSYKASKSSYKSSSSRRR